MFKKVGDTLHFSFELESGMLIKFNFYEFFLANRENVLQWIAALRSGEYIQCKGQLRKMDLPDKGHCCLGVAAQLHDLFELGTYDFGKAISPDSRLNSRWFGENFFLVNNDSLQTFLANLNDDGVSFAEIANILEDMLSAFN